MGRFIFWLKGKVYTWRNRVYFTEPEVQYLIDVVDMWIEAYPAIGDDAEDDEIPALHHDMSTAIDVRNKLWRQLSGN